MARIPSDHSWDTGSNCPYSWPIVIDLGLITVHSTAFSAISDWILWNIEMRKNLRKFPLKTEEIGGIAYLLCLRRHFTLILICLLYLPFQTLSLERLQERGSILSFQIWGNLSTWGRVERGSFRTTEGPVHTNELSKIKYTVFLILSQ